MLSLKEVIDSKKNNIGSLAYWLKNNTIYLEELKSLFDGYDYSLAEMLCCYIKDDYSKKLCICGAKRKFESFKRGWYKTCGNRECVVQNTKNTNIEIFGFENPNKNINVINKIKETNSKKSDEEKQATVDKRAKTVSEYTDQQKKGIIKKRQDTWNSVPKEKKDEIRKRIYETNEKIHGNGVTFKCEHIKEKIKKTNLERHGSELAVNSSAVRSKIAASNKKSNLKRLKDSLEGTVYEYVSHSENENETLIYTLYNNETNKEFEISASNLFAKLRNNVDEFERMNQRSQLEKSVYDFISLYHDTVIANHKKGNIHIDIYLPLIKVAFEINGVYWHSEKFKDKNFHINKTNKLNELGIKLIHLWEDDLYTKKNIVYSRILNVINSTPNKIYARKCEIKEINTSDARLFLDENHLQGFIASKIYIALFYNEKIVSVMTFGKIRYTKSDNLNDYELYRFANILNTNVIGAANKLFNYFIKNYKFDNIITYSDLSWNKSVVYDKMNFEFIGNTDIDYYWIVNHKRASRHLYTKKKLVADGADENLSETEIMYNKGYYKIFGCGNQKWIYKNKK